MSLSSDSVCVSYFDLMLPRLKRHCLSTFSCQRLIHLVKNTIQVDNFSFHLKNKIQNVQALFFWHLTTPSLFCLWRIFSRFWKSSLKTPSTIFRSDHVIRRWNCIQIASSEAAWWMRTKWLFLFQTSFRLELDPLQWGPDSISFQQCHNIEELLLVIKFIINHGMEVSGKLVVTFHK